jgi:FkbM family methyltransferase
MLSDSVASMNKEREALEWFLSHIDEGCVVWDIGANVGLWTLMTARRVGPAGKVVAFEPWAEAMTLLKANLLDNGVSNVVLRQEAMGQCDGEVTFFPAKHDVFSTSSLSFREGQFGTESTPIKVPLLSGASVAQQNPDLLPDAVKIDVEGAKQAVLEGFSDPIWRKLRILAIEVHTDFLPSLGGSKEQVRRLILDHDFRIVSESSRRDTLHWLCVKED